MWWLEDPISVRNTGRVMQRSELTTESQQPNLDVGFRFPSLGDASTLWQMAKDAGLDENSPYVYAMWCDYFAATSIVAIDRGEVAGFVIGFAAPEEPDCLFVWQVGVDERMRGRGIAQQMITNIAQRQGCRWIEATVTPGNEASAALFRSLATQFNTNVVEELAYAAEVFPIEHDAEIRFRIGPLRHDTNLTTIRGDEK